MTLFALPVLPELVLALTPLRLGARIAFWKACTRGGSVTSEMIAAYARAVGHPGARQALLATTRQMVPRDLAEVTAAYPSLTLPTLLIWGAHDPIVPLSVGQRLAAALPHARLEIVPDCGHVPQEEAPEETVRLVESFLGTMKVER